jgi:hypothetical protein
MPTTGKALDKDESLLTSVAETIGSTLGTIVAKANAAQEALGNKPVVKKVLRKKPRVRRRPAGKRRAAGFSKAKSKTARKSKSRGKR